VRAKAARLRDNLFESLRPSGLDGTTTIKMLEMEKLRLAEAGHCLLHPPTHLSCTGVVDLQIVREAQVIL
jgi:hypothetical protein